MSEGSFQEVSAEELATLLSSKTTAPTTRTKKPKYDVEDRTKPGIGVMKWFKLPHRIEGDCTYCGRNRMTFDVSLLGVQYSGKYMCRYCFLEGVDW